MKMTKKDHQVAFRRVMGLVCIYETAEMLGVSRQTLYRWQDAGKIPESWSDVGKGERCAIDCTTVQVDRHLGRRVDN